jgi:arabinogalactan endo-1,4-beta-galactosidase
MPIQPHAASFPPAHGRKRPLGYLIALALLSAGLAPALAPAAEPSQPPGLVLGADVSALATPGRGGRGAARVYQENGTTNEEWAILRQHGWTMFRLRVFVSPVRNAPNNSLENTIPLAKRIKAAGSPLLLCLHLSDTWADPQHQDIPAAWTNLNLAGLEKQVESHCHDVVRQLKDAGAMPDWVQVGNEITRGTLWPVAQLQIPGSTNYPPPQPYDEAKQWTNLTRLLKAGIRGVKAAAGDTPPRLAIHIDQGANWEVTRWFFNHLDEAKVEYDIIAQSFYPPWHHGTLDGLRRNMEECARRYHKDFAVVETGYGRSQVKDNPDMKWSQTPEGRRQFLIELIDTVQSAPRGISVMYWAPERDLWNDDGSPGPAVFVLDRATTLTNSPTNRAPSVDSR